MKSVKIIVFFIASLLLSGCTEEVYPEGSIVGFVRLFDSSGVPLDDHSGISVSLENTDITAVTNEDGRYEFQDVPTGTYNIVHQGDLYGEVKVFSYQMYGGSVPAVVSPVNLYQIPDVELLDLEISRQENMLDISVSLSEKKVGLSWFISDSSNVSVDNHDQSEEWDKCCTQVDFSTGIYLYNDDLIQADKIYVVVYFNNPAEKWFTYYNPEERRYLMSSLKKASGVIEVTEQ